MSEIPKAYEPQAVETKWYDFWMEQCAFVADAASKKPAYSIVIPPPNVTGVLTMGHVLNNTIQDALARKARMDGKEVLWLPGTDHAGIATEGQVVKQLRKEEKKSKQDIGREEFLKRVWTWKEKHGGIIIQQLKKLGCSCDWSRERFTMDPEYVRDVQRVFVDLYKKGLIYRGKRMVNWCPATQTALSDEEVDMRPQKGFMYHFKVQVADVVSSSRGNEAQTEKSENGQSLLTSAATGEKKGGPEIDSEGRIWLTIATTRPETIPGDTAVAVNPKDTRYAHLIGKHIVRPLPSEFPREKKLIPIIGDEHVDFEFGTGVLKVTPAHDKADFDIGLRHNLPVVDIMNPDATMNALAGENLAGLDRFEARKVAVEKLKELGSLTDEKPYENNVGFSERANVPIEPRLSEQWFLKYPSVEPSKACVDKGEMKFHPERWAKVYDHWLNNIQDWCISRQLWWGHRVPVYFQDLTSGQIMERFPALKDVLEVADIRKKSRLANNENGLGDDPAQSITPFVAELFSRGLRKMHGRITTKDQDLFRVEIATESPFELEELGFIQDPDVLDTWFSSWLWPFATMGWPEQTPTLKKFYPTTDLVTGPDIIFFWVARMIMAGYEYMHEMPFKNVYFTGIIRDKQGRKMSKSLGNSPDPLDLIAKYGADALRFGTMRGAPLGQDILFDEQNVELGRNFCNKLWNACRFRQMQGGEVQSEIQRTLLTPDDKWILLKLDLAIREITQSFAEYKFSEAAATIYCFFWSEYCDWYVEATKAVFQGTDAPRKANTLAVIDFVLSHTLRLFHPFLPFISEELWHGMGYLQDMPENQGGQSIMFAPWPRPLEEDFRGAYGLDDCYLEMTDKKYELVTQGRNLRREARIQSGKKAKYVLKPAAHISPHDIAVIKILLNADPLEVDASFAPVKGTPTVHSELGDLFLPLEGVIDVAAEKARLGKELEKCQLEIAKVEQKLNNPEFTRKVPTAVLAEHQKRLADWLAKKQHVEAALKALEG